MQRTSLLAAVALAAAAPLVLAVPDESGALVTPGDISSDSGLSARLNYNVGFERFEATRKLEMGGSGLQGAQARDLDARVKQGFREARDKFQAATAADPQMKEAWNMLGYTTRRLGEYQLSLEAYDKALALAPDYPEAIEYRAELFLLTGRFDQVKDAYAQLTQKAPSYAGVLKESMRDWVARSNAPGSSAAGRDAFAAWVATL